MLFSLSRVGAQSGEGAGSQATSTWQAKLAVIRGPGVDLPGALLIRLRQCAISTIFVRPRRVRLEDALVMTLMLYCMVLIALLIERLRPAQHQPAHAAGFNLRYTFAFTVVQAIIFPAVSIAASYAANAAGGGWIVLPTTGWSILPAFFAYALTVDFLEYAFHRAQHRVPVLWAMHSFHHSDQTLNESTVNRHYWAEPAIKTLSIFLMAGIIFKPGFPVLLLYNVVSFYNIFSHMNLRIGFGRWSWVVNSPQYHRIHHSARPEHYDCNFAALFPIFDVLFGSYYKPFLNEFPPTGIEGDDRPANLIEAFAWPVRKLMRRPVSNQKPAVGNADGTTRESTVTKT